MAPSAGPDRYLAIYLNDHLAGATLGVELARRLRSENRGDPEMGEPLARVCVEIEEDRETLIRLMERLGVDRSAASSSWRVSRLGSAARSSSGTRSSRASAKPSAASTSMPWRSGPTDRASGSRTCTWPPPGGCCRSHRPSWKNAAAVSTDRLEEKMSVIEAAKPASVPILRHRAREFAAAQGAGEQMVADVALAVSEAVTNVVKYAYEAGVEGDIELTGSAGPDELEIWVRDRGTGFGRGSIDGLGLGLSIIARLCEDMQIVQEGTGTEVRMRFAL